MRTFEEWMKYQAVDVASLGKDELEEWRSEYDTACEAQRRRNIWTPRIRANAKDLLYAVVVSDGSDLWLSLWVKRNAQSDYFVLFPRDEPGWNPHASYHRDGRFYQKSYNGKMMFQQRQVPGPGFKGTEQMLTTTIDVESARAVKALCDCTQCNGVLEVPERILHPGDHTVSVDLTEVNGSPVIQPCSELVMQQRFSGAVPQIVITLWKRQLGDSSGFDG